MNKSEEANQRKLAKINQVADSGCLCLVHADAVFYEEVTAQGESGRHTLHYYDSWADLDQKTEFKTEVELCKFVGDYLRESDGPNEEFMTRFPAEFDPVEPHRWNS